MLPNHTEHFLVPTNFGKTSRIARRLAFGWALETGARVTVLHVSPLSPPTTGLDAVACLHEVAMFRAVDAHRRLVGLEDLKLELHPELKGAVDLRLELRQGEVAKEIVRFSEQESVDAIVLGVRRWRWPAPWRTYLAQRLASRTSCQVLQVFEPPRRHAATSSHQALVSSAAHRLLAACGWVKC